MSDLLVLAPVALAIFLMWLGLGIYKVKQRNKVPEATAVEVLNRAGGGRAAQWLTDRNLHRQIGFFPKDTCGIVWDPVKLRFDYPEPPWPEWMMILAEHELHIGGHEKHCFQCKGGWSARARGTA